MNTIQERIDAHHESIAEKKPRPYLGISSIGHHCARKIWCDFRWVTKPNISGRIRRIFRRGHNEEASVVSDLEAIGFEVTCQQKEVNLGLFLKGHIDGLIDGHTLLEIKTTNDKGFKSLEKSGVAIAQPTHWAQVQCYMYGLNVNRALYHAVNKNDDKIYSEYVEFDCIAAKSFINRATDIVSADAMPKGVSDNSSWYKCKMCDLWNFCHERTHCEEVNCRTCVHGKAIKEPWYCDKYDCAIPVARQYGGCKTHRFMESIIDEPQPDGILSREWVAIKRNPEILKDDGFMALRDAFDGEIIDVT